MKYALLFLLLPFIGSSQITPPSVTPPPMPPYNPGLVEAVDSFKLRPSYTSSSFLVARPDTTEIRDTVTYEFILYVDDQLQVKYSENQRVARWRKVIGHADYFIGPLDEKYWIDDKEVRRMLMALPSRPQPNQ